MGRKKILIIEDDVSILRGLEDNLNYEGYETLTAPDGQKGFDLALSQHPDLLLLDIMLPGMSGYDICRNIKTRQTNLPIIMLTARGKEVDKVAGLDLGADDYITKPFGISELLARIRAVFRRYETAATPVDKYEFGPVLLDFVAFQTWVDDREIHLSSREYAIMKFFIQHQNQVIHRHTLLDEVWGYENFPTTRTVDNYILELRKKLESDPANPRHIISIRGGGYKFLP